MALIDEDTQEQPVELTDEEKAAKQELTRAQLAEIGKALETKKQAAITFRQASGIEDAWSYAEDAYAGIDAANRHEFSGTRMIKPLAMDVPVQTNQDNSASRSKTKSTAFVRLTTRYVDAGVAKICEIVLSMDNKSFSFSPTPVPTLITGFDDTTPIEENGQTLTKEVVPAPGQPPQESELTYKDVAEDIMATAMKMAKKAETRIADWQVECGHRREMRKVLFDSARLGSGVMKGPYPKYRKKFARVNSKVIIKKEIVPVNSWVDVWNIFPDPACGEDIHNGDHVFERDFNSEKQLRALIGLPGYLEDQIMLAISLGPKKPDPRGRNPRDQDDEIEKHPYELWYYTGTMKREDFEKVNADAVKELEDDTDQVDVIITMANDIVIRGSINPLTTGEFPYDIIPWVRRPGSCWGVGISEQGAVPQRITNSSVRAMLNNAGISAGPQIVINRKLIQPADGDYEVTPNKVWYLSEDGLTDDVKKAFISFDITNVSDKLMKIVELGMRLMEESTNIPLITQGQSGKTTPDTLGATQLQDNNANQLLRSIGYTIDESSTVPMTNRYYEYLLLDPNVPDDEKGEFSIDAHGSVAMVERSIQDQTIAQMTPLAQNPIFGVNPKKWFATLARTKKLNPADFQYTKEEQAKIDSQPPPKAPAVEAAEIKAKVSVMQLEADQQRAQEEDALQREIAQLDAQTLLEIENIRNTTAQLRVKLDTDRDTVYAQTEAARAQAEFTNRIQELQLKRELAIMDHANKNQLSVNQVKAKLADTAMKLTTQKELAAMQAKLDIHAHNTPSGDAIMKPAIQVPGKAGQGKALSQL